jgi:capsular exopolysaccharide synthesis family protein
MIKLAAPPRREVQPCAEATRVAAAGAVAEQLVSLVAPGSVAADQYRTLRSAIDTLRKDSGLHVLAVTSPSPGDGKTVTTLNLAGALAQAPTSRVLVIDGDLRKPSVASYLGLEGAQTPGVADALRDPRYELRHIVRYLADFNLWVAPAGAPERSPYELLSAARLDAILREARRDFDFVMVDTPPAVLLPDCRLIGRWVDGFILVVTAHRTPRARVTEALDQLDPAKVLGVVFNGDDQPQSPYYGYYGHGQ